MFAFLKKLFFRKRTKETDEEAVVHEAWKTDFRSKEKSRFRPESTDSYKAEFVHGGFLLSCTQKGVFAWSVNPVYRYSDCVIDSLISFPGQDDGDVLPSGGGAENATASAENAGNAGNARDSAGSFAAGFLFRYINDSTFYSVLVSDRGLVRMDVVINGTPSPILGWTGIAEVPDDEASGGISRDRVRPFFYADKPVFSLRIIAQHTSFTIILNDRWIAECEDDTIQSPGKIAFAVQNWNARNFSRALLENISVDSRPFEVEALYTRWNQYIKIPAEARINLAQTKYAMGQYPAALIELKKAWKTKEPDVDGLLFATQICLVQSLYPEAEAFARRAVEEAEARGGADLAAKAHAELGGVLYAAGDFAGLSDLLARIPAETIDASPFLLNLSGHVAFRAGDFETAAEKYMCAAKKMPDQPLFGFYAGNALSLCGRKAEAVEFWLSAGRMFLRENDFLDLGSLFPELEKAAPGDERVVCLGVKYFYAAGDSARLAEYAAKAETVRSDDSSLWYVLGLWNSERGNEQKALDFYLKAAALEPDFALYRFRVAENLFNRNLDYKEALAAAVTAAEKKTAGTDAADAATCGWIHNLSALAALRENDLDRAVSEIVAARRALPDEKTVLVNDAEIERRRGNLDAALKLFDKSDADLLHAGANLLVDDKRYEDADEWYKAACKRRPFDAELLADRAANCIQLGLLNEADDLLGKSLDREKSPRAYRLVGFLAGRKGDYARAEVALLTAIAEFPADTDLLYDLSTVYLLTDRPAKAEALAQELRAKGRADLADKLSKEICGTSPNSFACSSCNRQWFVPKDIPLQGRLSITAQPPDDLPAGKCPECGNVYCIACAKKGLDDSGRFHCLSCGAALKLSEANIIWVLSKWQEEASPRDG